MIGHLVHYFTHLSAPSPELRDTFSLIAHEPKAVLRGRKHFFSAGRSQSRRASLPMAADGNTQKRGDDGNQKSQRPDQLRSPEKAVDDAGRNI
jgi:hypothetical protein